MAHQQRYQAAKRVTFVNAATNSLLAIFKIVIGYIGHSQALIADGLHSFSDLISDALVLFAAKAGDKNPDADHPYGHRRIETIASIIIAFILLAVAIAIVYEAIQNLIHHVIEKPDIYVVIVAIVSIIANEGLFRYTFAIGKKIHSNLLISNAWHNRSDVLVSAIVLISVIGTMVGMHYLDAIGAIIIALFIAKMSFQMIWVNVSELIDQGVDEKTLAEITQYIQQMPGVAAIHQLRTRKHSGNILIDLHIIVDPSISVSEGHHISESVHLSLIKHFKKISDVTTHIDPEDDEINQPSSHLPHRVEIEKQLNINCKMLPCFDDIHKTLLHYLNGELHIEIFIPLSKTKNQNLKELNQLYQTTAKKISHINSITLHFTMDEKP